MRRKAGFSLIELLVATAVLGILVMYLTRTFTAQHRTYQVVDQVAEAQQNMRAVGALLERDVRQAGFMVPDGGAVCGIDQTASPDTLYVSDAEVIDPEGFTSPELGATVSGYAGGNGSDVLTLGTVWPAVTAGVVVDNDPYYDADGDGTEDSDFRVNAGAILFDYENPDRGRACGIVTNVEPNTQVTVMFQNSLVAFNSSVHGTPDLRLVPAHVYMINNGNLERNGLVLAPDVEDLQVAYFYDLDEDGAVDNDEWPGADSEPGYDPGTDDWEPSELREVRVNFVTRSRAEDANTDFQEGLFEATENRAALTTPDGFRRRVYTATIRLRNLGTRDLPV
jgi:prepilin-type N-terminal cleavage/methylation domain-containing protein